MALLDLSRSETRRRLLGLLFAQPDLEVYQRELERQLRMSIGAVQHEIRKLEADGLLKRRKLGNLALFSLNRAHPLYDEFASIVAKTVGIAPALADALRDLNGVKIAFIYGSHVSLFGKTSEARSWSAASDVDVMVIGELDAKTLAAAHRSLGERYRREINSVLLSPSELRHKIQEHDSFLLEVLGKPILPLSGFPPRDYSRPVRLRPGEILKLLSRGT